MTPRVLLSAAALLVAGLVLLPGQLLDPEQSSYPRVQSSDHALDGYVVSPEVQSIERLRRFAMDRLKRAAKAEIVQLQVQASTQAEDRARVDIRHGSDWLAAQQENARHDWQVALITRGRHTGTLRYRDGDRIVTEPLPGYGPERWRIYPATFEMLYLRMESERGIWLQNRRPYAFAFLRAEGLFDEDTVRDLLARLRSEYYSNLTHVVAASDVGCFVMDYAAFPLYYWFDATPVPARGECTKRIDCQVAGGGESRAACRTITAPRHLQISRPM